MRTVVFGALACALLAGCQSAAEKEAAERAILENEAKAAMSEQLVDPTASLFTDLVTRTSAASVCGYVNAKNRFGGYVGRKRFVWVRGGTAILEADMASGASGLEKANSCVFDASFDECVNDLPPTAHTQCYSRDERLETKRKGPRTRQEARSACLEALTDRFNRREHAGKLASIRTDERYDYESPSWKVQIQWRAEGAQTDSVARLGECVVTADDVKVVHLD